VHIYYVHLSWFLLALDNHFWNRIYALYTSIHVATLWFSGLINPISFLFYFWLLQCHEIFLKKRIMLWKTWFLLSESILNPAKYSSLQTLYFTWHTSGSRSEACLLYQRIVIFVILSSTVLVQANDHRSSHLHVAMAAVVSSMRRNRGVGAVSTSVTNLLWWALLQPLISYASVVPQPSRQWLLVYV
jgi:hypothetical protein